MHKGWLGGALLVVVAACLSWGALHWLRTAQAETCAVCKRPVHQHSRTVALVNGRKVYYCCPSCALSEHHQDGKPVNVIELTDYATGARLAPADAWVVRGSDVNPCVRNEALVNADRRIAPVEFDRCAPGLLAFARREDAAAFLARHGGRLLLFSEITPAFAH